MDLGRGMASRSPLLDVAGRAGAAGPWSAPATRVRPVTFEGHFGSLHTPTREPGRGAAVLVCPPVGRDARCAYRPLFLFAEALAAQGFPVLRYDHLGGGDSMPLDAEADHWPLWAAGVVQAAAFLRTHSGASRLVVVGLRIGASLAALAAPAVRPDGLRLMAPTASGKAWVRELQMAAAMVGLAPPADGSVEIDGLRLSRATLDSVQSFELNRLARIAAPTFLATPTPDPRLAQALGPAVTTAPFEGYAELFKEAHLNALPEAVFAAASAWLQRLAAETPVAAPAAAPPRAQLVGQGWSERPVAFGAGLRGVLCLPARRGPGPAVIFGNTGGDPRAGIGGFATRACRELAGRGVAALRFDFAGLGESESPGEAWRPHVYETSRTQDLLDAADLLASHGYDEAVVAGVCAGGYHALRALIEAPRFCRAMAINSWLVWRAHDPLELTRPIAPPRRRINVFALVRPSGWRRLLTGEVRAGAAFATLLRRARQRLRVRPPDAIGRAARAEIAAAAERGARLLVLVGRDDESMDGLETDFGFRGRWLARRPGVTVTEAAGLDHGLFSLESQDVALAELLRFVGLAPEPPRRLRPRSRSRFGLAFVESASP